MGELKPLTYHTAVLNYLKKYEEDVFKWYESAESQSNYTDAMRLELLKSSYRLEPASHPGLYSIADEIQEIMDIDECPLTLYKSDEGHTGAAIFYAPGEMHICLYGDILDRLDQDELKAVLAHEAGHFQLFTMEAGHYLISNRILSAAAGRLDSDDAHIETCRRFSLMSEIYCDRNAYSVCENIDPMITSLVKLQSGMKEVDPAAYLRQVNDIMSSGKIESEGVTHPEIYIRCAALQMYIDDPESADDKIFKLISSTLSIASPDIIEQLTLTYMTERFISDLLKPAVFKDEILKNQAKFYQNEEVETEGEMEIDWKALDKDTQEYFISLIFDFTFVNPDLKEVMLCWGNHLCSERGWNKQFSDKLKKEFKFKAAEMKKIFTSYSKEEIESLEAS